LRSRSSWSSSLLVVVAACAVTSGSGCGDPSNAPAAVEFDACQPLLIASDAEITDDQLAGIQGALDLWNAAAATSLKLAKRDDAGGRNATASLPLHFQAAAAAFHGLYDDRGVQIFINDDLGDHPRMVAIAHEIGHALGLVHVAPAERASVMNAGNITIVPTAGDAAALVQRWGACAPSAGSP